MEYIRANNVYFTDPGDYKSCFRGGLLAELHSYAFDLYKTAITSRFQSSENIEEMLTELKDSSKLTVRQYLFAAGLGSSYQQMCGSNRTVSSDDAAKTMFAHLIDLIKPTCTDVMLDLTGPGSVSQLTKKEGLTGKLEMAYATYRSFYNYTFVLVIEMKSLEKTISMHVDIPEECQMLGEMAYFLKKSGRNFILGILFIAGFVTVYLLRDQVSHYQWTKLLLQKEVRNESVGKEIEQLIYHCIHNTLQVDYEHGEIKVVTKWKNCSILEALYIKDEICTTASLL